MQNYRSNQLSIHIPSIKENINILRQHLSSSTRMMVMVKSLAYGTNALYMAQFLETCGIDIFGVSFVAEAVALRKSGIKQSLFVLHATPQEASQIVKKKIEVGISQQPLICALEAAAQENQVIVPVHLNINTGMGRLGCPYEQALDLAKKIHTSPYLSLEGVMTHFSCADDPASDDFTLAQSKTFDTILSQMKQEGIVPHYTHAANSSAVLRFNFPNNRSFSSMNKNLGSIAIVAMKTIKVT